MTEYIPGRIYSGIRDGDPRELFMWSGRYFVGLNKAPDAEGLTDVRGALVVLDLHAYNEAVINWLTERLRDLDASIAHDVADQIERQTKPLLQEGVHLARLDDMTSYLRWDGDRWWQANGTPLSSAWESVRFIGSAGGDA